MAIEVLRYYAEWATKIEGSTIPARGNNFVYLIKRTAISGRRNPGMDFPQSNL